MRKLRAKICSTYLNIRWFFIIQKSRTSNYIALILEWGALGDFHSFNIIFLITNWVLTNNLLFQSIYLLYTRKFCTFVNTDNINTSSKFISMSEKVWARTCIMKFKTVSGIVSNDWVFKLIVFKHMLFHITIEKLVIFHFERSRFWEAIVFPLSHLLLQDNVQWWFNARSLGFMFKQFLFPIKYPKAQIVLQLSWLSLRVIRRGPRTCYFHDFWASWTINCLLQNSVSWTK